MIAAYVVEVTVDPYTKLYWSQKDDRFYVLSGPRTLYPTKEEAEGGLMWVLLCRGWELYAGILHVRAVNSEGVLVAEGW